MALHHVTRSVKLHRTTRFTFHPISLVPPVAIRLSAYNSKKTTRNSSRTATLTFTLLDCTTAFRPNRTITERQTSVVVGRRTCLDPGATLTTFTLRFLH